jgi:hypothetical protein
MPLYYIVLIFKQKNRPLVADDFRRKIENKLLGYY